MQVGHTSSVISFIHMKPAMIHSHTIMWRFSLQRRRFVCLPAECERTKLLWSQNNFPSLLTAGAPKLYQSCSNIYLLWNTGLWGKNWGFLQCAFEERSAKSWFKIDKTLKAPPHGTLLTSFCNLQVTFDKKTFAKEQFESTRASKQKIVETIATILVYLWR